MRRYVNKDPYQMTAKYNGVCSACGKPIKKGDTMYYWPANPRNKRSTCECGAADYRRFLCSVADEAVYASQY